MIDRRHIIWLEICARGMEFEKNVIQDFCSLKIFIDSTTSIYVHDTIKYSAIVLTIAE